MITILKAVRISQKITSVVAIHQQCKYNQKNFTCPSTREHLILANKIYRIWKLVIFIMLPKQTSNFIDQITLKLQQYQHEKAIRLDRNHPGPSIEQHKAKQTLIDLDEETQPGENQDEDIVVGRWSNYRVPISIEERLSIGKKSRRKSLNPPPANRYLEYPQRAYLPNISRSEKTIPKLKVILHQLECPLIINSERRSKKSSTSAQQPKMRNHIGMQALVISNRQEIRPTIKTERKSTLISDYGINIENQRPPSSHFKATSTSNSYQKIKRTIGNTQDCELVYQKQILSQLIKGNLNRTNENQLANMMNFFSKTESKKKVSTKLGLDKLLS